MKKFCLIIFVCLFSLSIKLYGLNFSLGVYQQHGKTYVQEISVAPYDSEEILDFSKTTSGDFLQGQVHFNKIAFGIEYGTTKFYYMRYKYWEPYSYRYSSFSYKPKNISALIQFKVIKSFFIQVGIGNYFLDKFLSVGSDTGYVFSIGYHLKISKSINIPFFSRAIFLTGKENPVGITFGLGLEIRTI